MTSLRMRVVEALWRGFGPHLSHYPGEYRDMADALDEMLDTLDEWVGETRPEADIVQRSVSALLAVLREDTALRESP